jgi:hypothetical protein
VVHKFLANLVDLPWLLILGRVYQSYSFSGAAKVVIQNPMLAQHQPIESTGLLLAAMKYY